MSLDLLPLCGRCFCSLDDNNGYILSCYDLICSNCLNYNQQKNHDLNVPNFPQNCPICEKKSIKALLLNKNTLPSEVKSYLCDPFKEIQNYQNIIKFQINFYQSTIKRLLQSLNISKQENLILQRTLEDIQDPRITSQDYSITRDDRANFNSTALMMPLKSNDKNNNLHHPMNSRTYGSSVTNNSENNNVGNENNNRMLSPPNRPYTSYNPNQSCNTNNRTSHNSNVPSNDIQNISGSTLQSQLQSQSQLQHLQSNHSSVLEPTTTSTANATRQNSNYCPPNNHLLSTKLDQNSSVLGKRAAITGFHPAQDHPIHNNNNNSNTNNNNSNTNNNSTRPQTTNSLLYSRYNNNHSNNHSNNNHSNNSVTTTNQHPMISPPTNIDPTIYSNNNNNNNISANNTTTNTTGGSNSKLFQPLSIIPLASSSSSTARPYSSSSSSSFASRPGINQTSSSSSSSSSNLMNNNSNIMQQRPNSGSQATTNVSFITPSRLRSPHIPIIRSPNINNPNSKHPNNYNHPSLLSSSNNSNHSTLGLGVTSPSSSSGSIPHQYQGQPVYNYKSVNVSQPSHTNILSTSQAPKSSLQKFLSNTTKL